MTLPPLPDLPKPAYLRRLQRPDGGYSMVPAYTPGEMRDYARAAIAAHVPEAAFGNIAAVPAQPVAWLGGGGWPHHISAVQTITERRIYGPWQPLYAAPQAVPVPAAGWKCKAITADFSDQTVTLQMSSPDWYLQAGEYTLIPPAAAPKEHP